MVECPTATTLHPWQCWAPLPAAPRELLKAQRTSMAPVQPQKESHIPQFGIQSSPGSGLGLPFYVTFPQTFSSSPDTCSVPPGLFESDCFPLLECPSSSREPSKKFHLLEFIFPFSLQTVFASLLPPLVHSTCSQLGTPLSPPSVGTPKEWGPEFIPPVSHIGLTWCFAHAGNAHHL